MPEPSLENSLGKYLPLECPNCGFQGKVKIARLDQTFHCKQCNQVFHVTRDGTVAGERPVGAVQEFRPPPPTDDDEPALVRRIRTLPKAALYALGGVMVLLLCYGVSLLLEPAKPLPGDLDARGALAATSLAKDDWSTLKRLAKSGTTGDLSKWYQAVRPADWEDVTAESRVDVKLLKTTKKLKKYEGTKPVIDTIVTVKITVPEKDPLEIALVFNDDKEAQWWLDGSQMLKRVQAPENAPRPKPKAAADAKGEPEEGEPEATEN